LCSSFFTEEVAELEAYADTADSKNALAPQQALRNFLSHPDTLADFLQGRRQIGGLFADQLTGTPTPTPHHVRRRAGQPPNPGHVQPYASFAAMGSCVSLEEGSACYDPDAGMNWLPVQHAKHGSVCHLPCHASVQHAKLLGNNSCSSSASSTGQLGPAYETSGDEEEGHTESMHGSALAACKQSVWAQLGCAEKLPAGTSERLSFDRSWSGLSCGQQAALQSFNGAHWTDGPLA
jgi:hypothetical protein